MKNPNIVKYKKKIFCLQNNNDKSTLKTKNKLKNNWIRWCVIKVFSAYIYFVVVVVVAIVVVVASTHFTIMFYKNIYPMEVENICSCTTRTLINEKIKKYITQKQTCERWKVSKKKIINIPLTTHMMYDVMWLRVPEIKYTIRVYEIKKKLTESYLGYHKTITNFFRSSSFFL